MAEKTFLSLWVHQQGDKRYHSAPWTVRCPDPSPQHGSFGPADLFH